MKNIRRLGIAAAVLVAAQGAAFAADVGVSVSVSQPGFYGRIDINQPPPPTALIFPQPVIIQQPPVRVVQQPIYLRVPPGHAKNWGKHCGKYNACGTPVYFIQDSYYQQHYVVQQPPRVVNGQPVMVVSERRGGDHPGRGHGKGKDKDHGKDHKGGEGKGKGHGQGKGHGKHD